MLFEFDQDKSIANALKHGLDFVRAQELWQDPFLMVVPLSTNDEPRWMAHGELGGKCWSAIFTRREGRIRLISVRRARENERERYESERS